MDDLLEITYNLAGEHLSLAVRQLFRSRELRMNPEHPWSWVEAHREALSSILHAYSGFEAAVNLIGHNLFFNTRSRTYVPLERRDLPLQRMVQAWPKSVAVTEKLNYILSVSGGDLPPKLKNELCELNNLRNWIAHGFSYSTTVLVEKQEDGTLLQVDREDEVDWGAKFPNTKFQALDLIDDHDGTTAVEVVLEGMKVLAVHNAETLFWINPLWKRPDYQIIEPSSMWQSTLEGRNPEERPNSRAPADRVSVPAERFLLCSIERMRRI